MIQQLFYRLRCPARAVLLLPWLLLACTGSGGGSSPPVSTPPPSGASGAAGATAAMPVAAREPLKVAITFISAETLPVWAAQELGLFDKYGLQAEVVSILTGAQAPPAMAAGDVHLALMTGLAVVEYDLVGGDLVIVAGYSNEMRYFLHARPEIQRIEDLRGQRIGITRRGAGIDMATRIFLERAGLSYERDATIIQLGTARDQVNALVAGAVDAAVVAVPTNFQAERLGFPRVADTKQYHVPFPTNVLAVRREFLSSRPEAVRRYLQAHIEAVEILRRDKALAKRLLAQGTSTDDDEILERSYQLFLEDLQDVPYPSEAALQGVLDLVARERPEAHAADPRAFYDDRLVRELDQSGFIRGLRGS
ncbi:MAG: ABC transporter substrate-binding protein [Chloroflexi bacterium]|nr:ABC transporter substrate-binding protein [Chloroflexota bacterium]